MNKFFTLLAFLVSLAFCTSLQAQSSCAAAVTLVVGGNSSVCTANNYNVTSQPNTSNVTPLGCGAGQQRDFWARFTASSASTTVRLYEKSSNNVGMLIYQGPCAAAMTYITCAGFTPDVLDNIVVIPTTPGTVYYIRVMRANNNAIGIASLCVYNTPPPPPPPAPSTPCPENGSFELGNTTGWTCKSGFFDGTIQLPNVGCINTGGNNAANNHSNRHVIMTDKVGTDPNSLNLVPYISPEGGNYSFRLGDKDVLPNCPAVCPADAEGISFEINVTKQNAGFTYMYAAFLQDAGHFPIEQPRFQIEIRKKSDNSLLPCGFYSVVASNANQGFQAGAGDWQYSNWTKVGLDLTAYIGQTLILEFRTADCRPCTGASVNGACAGNTYSAGAHGAYAYIDAICSAMEIKAQEFCAGAGTVQICAPDGYTNYSWPAGQPGLAGSPTTKCVTINNPVAGTTYTVNMVSLAGCPTSATTIIQNIPLLTSNDTTVCVGQPVNLLVSVTNGQNPPYTFNWSHGLGTSQSVTANPSASTVYSVTVTNGIGCTSQKNINVTVNCGVVPLEVLNFQALAGEAKVDLRWYTNAEYENDYFLVERSSNNRDFEEVSRLQAERNSTSLKEYTVYDHNPVRGYSYYRLRQVKTDGSHRVSEAKSVLFGKSQDQQLVVIPLSENSFRVMLPFSGEPEAVLCVYNYMGQMLFQKKYSLTEGLNQLDVELPFITGDLNLVRLQVGDTFLNAKVNPQK